MLCLLGSGNSSFKETNVSSSLTRKDKEYEEPFVTERYRARPEIENKMFLPRSLVKIMYCGELYIFAATGNRLRTAVHNFFNAGADFRRQNMTSIDVRL